MHGVMGTFSFYFEQAGHLDSSIIADCTEIFLVFDERYQLDAKILFIIINNSTCFEHLYAHLQAYRLYATAYGVQHCKRELCISVWFHFMFFVVLCNMQ